MISLSTKSFQTVVFVAIRSDSKCHPSNEPSRFIFSFTAELSSLNISAMYDDVIRVDVDYDHVFPS